MKVKLYNSFASKKSGYRLDSIELYIYALLQTKYMPFLKCAETSLSILAQDQIVFQDKNERRIIEKVKEVIGELVKKNVIQIENDLNDRNARLKVNFLEVDKAGYEFIDQETWMKIFSFGDYRYLHVYFIIKKNKGIYELSKDQWSNVLGFKSKNTGCDLVDKMVSDGIIHVEIGKREKDEEGKYNQKPSKWSIDKVEGKDKIRNGDEVIYAAGYDVTTVGHIKQLIQDSNWGKKEYGVDVELEYDDYELFRISKDEKVDLRFNKRCENVIAKKRKSDQYDGIFDVWEERYLKDKEEYRLQETV